MGELLRNTVLITVAGTSLMALNALLHHLMFRDGGGRGSAGRRLVALALAAELLCSSCVSVRALPPAALANSVTGASVEVQIFETLGAKKNGLHTVRTVVSELWRKEGHAYVLVREAKEAIWAAAELPPGTYKVCVRHWVDEAGAEQRLPSSDHAVFSLSDGDRVRVDVVLRHPHRLVAGFVYPIVIVGVLWAIGSVMMSGWTMGFSTH